MLFPFSLRADFELSLGMDIYLISHNYPDHYPPYAYVLWTFQYASGNDKTDIWYQFQFGNVSLEYGDYLTFGYGSDPENATAIIATFEDYYPADLFIEPVNIYVEFKADDYNYAQASGFKLNLIVRDISGRNLFVCLFVCLHGRARVCLIMTMCGRYCKNGLMCMCEWEYVKVHGVSVCVFVCVCVCVCVCVYVCVSSLYTFLHVRLVIHSKFEYSQFHVNIFYSRCQEV